MLALGKRLHTVDCDIIYMQTHTNMVPVHKGIGLMILQKILQAMWDFYNIATKGFSFNSREGRKELATITLAIKCMF